MEDALLVPTWQRPAFVRTDGKVDYALYCYADRELEVDLVVDGDDGYPDEDALEYVRCWPVSAAEWDEHPGGRLLEEAGSEAALEALGPAQVERLRWMNVVVATLPDPQHLAYLQTVWAMVRQIVRAGASVIREEGTGRFFLASEIMARDPRRAFSPAAELLFIRETDAHPELGYVLNTRGMHKFARPDLLVVTDGSEEHIAFAAKVLQSICDAMALGAVFGPGPVQLWNGDSVHLDRYRPGINGPVEDPLFGPGLVVRLA